MGGFTHSTPYSPAAPNIMRIERVLTDCVTGETTNVCVMKDLDAGTQTIYNEDGTLYTGPAPTPGVLELEKHPVVIPLGNAQVNDLTAATDLATAGVTVPQFAQGFFAEVQNGDLLYTTDGTAPSAADPDALVGTRVGNGGRICVEGNKAINNLQFASLDGNPVDLNIEFSNVYDDKD